MPDFVKPGLIILGTIVGGSLLLDWGERLGQANQASGRGFIAENPWKTFFIATSLIGTTGAVARAYIERDKPEAPPLQLSDAPASNILEL